MHHMPTCAVAAPGPSAKPCLVLHEKQAELWCMHRWWLRIREAKLR